MLNKEIYSNIGFKKIPESKTKHLKNKKYFEIKDMTSLVEDAWCFFIKGRKGIGKSYALNQLMLSCLDNPEDKFFYIRTIKEDLVSKRADWDGDENWPYFIKGNKILLKSDGKTIKGRIAFANDLGSLRSGNYKGFKYIIYDEFVEQKASRYKNKETFAKHFVLFLLDVNRDVNSDGVLKNIKVYCFGNNNIQFDPFTKYFKIDVIGEGFNYDKSTGIMFADLKDYYIGVLDNSNRALSLAFYNDELKTFISDNKPVDDLSNIINYSETLDAITAYYIAFNDEIFSFNYKYGSNKYIIVKLREGERPINGLPVFAADSYASLCFKSSILMSENFRKSLLNTHCAFYKTSKFEFTDTDDLTDYLNNVAPYVTKN